MSRADDLRAELELVELEGELSAAKGDGVKTRCDKCGQRIRAKRSAKAEADFVALKNKVRAARKASRQAREA